MKKKLLSLFLTICMVISLMPVTVSARIPFTRDENEFNALQPGANQFMIEIELINYNIGSFSNNSDGVGVSPVNSLGYDDPATPLIRKYKLIFDKPEASEGYVATELHFEPFEENKIKGFIKENEIFSDYYGTVDGYNTSGYTTHDLSNLSSLQSDGSYSSYYVILNKNATSSNKLKIVVNFAQAEASEIPGQPTNLRWNGTKATWDPVNDATGYKVSLTIEQMQQGGYPYYPIVFSTTVDTDTTEYDFGDLMGNSNYSFCVSAIKNKICSDRVPGPVKQGQHTHIYGEWIIDTPATETTQGAKHRVCADCGYTENAVIAPTSPTTPVTPPVTPTYPSNTTPIAPTVIDKLVVKASADENTVTLNWNEIKNADEYIVYCKNNGEYEEVLRTKDTSALCINLKNGKTYDFLVKYSKNGEVVSDNCWGKTSAFVYYKPVVKATSANNSVRLKWKIVPGAEKYAVYKYVNGKAVKLCETEKLAARIVNLKPDTEYKYIVRAYVDVKWTTMKKSNVVIVKTTSD